MNWKERKVWFILAAVVVGLYAIYSFAAPEQPAASEPPKPQTTRTVREESSIIGSVEPIRLDLLEPKSGAYKSSRNLFAFVQPPPPPPPKAAPPPPPPPDRDRDGVPDFSDNCPDTPNPDQKDIDRDGIGTACEKEPELVPPPPPPQPPPFTYKYIGNFGPERKQIAVFSNGDEILDVREGEIFGGNRFILRKVGLESADIGFVGFPPERTKRVAIGP
ncbi:MAG: thrombospondin type 3 repeat-containing protein [Thermoanaerobaculia bacterium]